MQASEAWPPRKRGGVMGKGQGRKGGGKNGGRKSAGLVSSEDEGDRWSDGGASSEASFLSGDVTQGGGGEEAEGAEDGDGGIMEAIEMLSEKRTSTREAGLRTLMDALRSYTSVDVLLQNKETTMSSLVPLIKRAGNSEGVLVAQTLGLVMLLLGPDEDAAFAEVLAPLEFVITRSSHAEYRAEAASALALSCFICCSNGEASLQVLELMEAIFSGESEGVQANDDLKAAAVDGWALLASVAPNGYMTDDFRARLLNIFYGLLSSPSSELKLAAGEALAFLNEYWIEARSGFEYPEEEEEVVDSIVQKLSDLAREGSKRISKKERKQQRSSFREVYRAFAESEPPEEVISFRTQSFRLKSWAKVKQMEALRDCLQGGFLAHLELNSTIHDIFDIPAHTFTELQDRRVVDKTSETGKLRTCARTRNRRSRENAKHHFLDAEGGGGAAEEG